MPSFFFTLQMENQGEHRCPYSGCGFYFRKKHMMEDHIWRRHRDKKERERLARREQHAGESGQGRNDKAPRSCTRWDSVSDRGRDRSPHRLDNRKPLQERSVPPQCTAGRSVTPPSRKLRPQKKADQPRKQKADQPPEQKADPEQAATAKQELGVSTVESGMESQEGLESEVLDLSTRTTKRPPTPREGTLVDANDDHSVDANDDRGETEFILSLSCSELGSLSGSPYRPYDYDAPLAPRIATPSMAVAPSPVGGSLDAGQSLPSPPGRQPDPRSLFLDAPSLHDGSPVAGALRAFRETALGGDTGLSFRHGAGSITRVEEARLPDGTLYRLESTWQPDPRPPLCLHCAATQTMDID